MILFGNRVFVDIIKVRIEIRTYWVRVGPNFNESVFMRQKRTHRDTQRRLYEDRSRDWRCIYKPRDTTSHQKLEEARKVSPGTLGRSMALLTP